MKVIKVVARLDDSLVSSSARGRGMVIYTPGHPAYPPDWLAAIGHGLFAFDTVENAVYNGLDRTAEVWLAEGNGPLPLPRQILPQDLQLGRLQFPNHHPHPKGSLTFSSITLIRKLWPPPGWQMTENPFWVAPLRPTIAQVNAALYYLDVKVRRPYRARPQKATQLSFQI